MVEWEAEMCTVDVNLVQNAVDCSKPCNAPRDCCKLARLPAR